MNKSIMPGNIKGRCYFCRRICNTENHHIFYGRNRKRSDVDGMTVYLCHSCHNEPPNGVHFNKTRDMFIKRLGQGTWMRYYGKTHDDFIQAYGRNYLVEDEE